MDRVIKFQEIVSKREKRGYATNQILKNFIQSSFLYTGRNSGIFDKMEERIFQEEILPKIQSVKLQQMRLIFYARCQHQQITHINFQNLLILQINEYNANPDKLLYLRIPNVTSLALEFGYQFTSIKILSKFIFSHLQKLRLRNINLKEMNKLSEMEIKKLNAIFFDYSSISENIPQHIIDQNYLNWHLKLSCNLKYETSCTSMSRKINYQRNVELLQSRHVSIVLSDFEDSLSQYWVSNDVLIYSNSGYDDGGDMYE